MASPFPTPRRHASIPPTRLQQNPSISQVTHDTLFLGQDHRVLRDTKLGHERLSAWDQDVIRWRQWAVRNARGYASDQSSLTSVTVPTANAQDASTDRESAEVTGLALAAGAVEA